jgi:hypothetical protein
MEKAGNVKIQRALLTWLINATLVLSVLAFSGHVSQSKASSFEPARTELKQHNRVSTQRIVRFKVIRDASSQFLFFDQVKNFQCCRGQYDRQIEVKLRGNERTYTNKDQHFLVHYFTYNSEESGTDGPRG